jgi:plasmid segregation protein ParM
MELIVRAVDVGSGNTKFVTAAAGTDIRCASFPSVAYPSSDNSPSWAGSERKKTVCIPIGPLFYEVGPDVSLPRPFVSSSNLRAPTIRVCMTN